MRKLRQLTNHLEIVWTRLFDSQSRIVMPNNNCYRFKGEKANSIYFINMTKKCLCSPFLSNCTKCLSRLFVPLCSKWNYFQSGCPLLAMSQMSGFIGTGFKSIPLNQSKNGQFWLFMLLLDWWIICGLLNEIVRGAKLGWVRTMLLNKLCIINQTVFRF